MSQRNLFLITLVTFLECAGAEKVGLPKLVEEPTLEQINLVGKGDKEFVVEMIEFTSSCNSCEFNNKDNT